MGRPGPRTRTLASRRRTDLPRSVKALVGGVTTNETVLVRMVALDLDGTLVDQEDAAARWAEEFIRTHDLDVSVDVVASALTERRPKGEIFSELIATHRIDLGPDQMWADYRRRMPQLVTCTDEDRNALVALRAAGWRLGIVTNGMVDNQEGKIRQLGLDALVDAWVISDEVGVRKPAPEIFHLLSARLDCPLDGWMIGDSVELDISGGAAVGLRTALIADSDTADSGGADLLVGSVAEAAQAILKRVD